MVLRAAVKCSTNTCLLLLLLIAVTVIFFCYLVILTAFRYLRLTPSLITLERAQCISPKAEMVVFKTLTPSL